MQKKYKALAAMDFDGTLHSHISGLPNENREILERLGELGICRAVVTGRNLESFMKVSTVLDLKIDYLIFSTGAGVLSWNKREILKKESLSAQEVQNIKDIIIGWGLDFMIQKEIPDNHEFYYHRSGQENRDFEARMAIYEDGARPLSQMNKDAGASQFVVVLPPGMAIPEDLIQQLDGFSLIRATSPIDHNSIWLEIFPKDVHKGSGILWLRNRLELNDISLMAVGNDYNDLDMLKAADSAWVVKNAPEVLKNEFRVTDSCEKAGVKTAIERWLKESGHFLY